MPATQSKGLCPSTSSGLFSPIHVRKPHSFLAVINHHINGIIANRMIWITLVIALEIHKFKHVICRCEFIVLDLYI